MFVDWLGFTLLDEQARVLTRVRSFFTDWEEQPHGGNGYTCSAKVWDTGRVFWHPGRPEMGLNVRLPSSALARYVGDPVDLIVQWCKVNAHCTRLDIAADDTDYHLLDLAVIEEKIGLDEFVCRGHKSDQHRNLYGGAGNTIYFGARSSDTLVRIYDKAAEQATHGEQEGIPNYWIRVEMELKGERARRAGQFIVEHPDDWRIYAAGWLYDYLDFKMPDFSDQKKYRWETCEWWSDFLDQAGKCKLLGERKVATLEDVRAWVEKQVSPSLFVLAATIGHDELFQIVGQGSERLTPRQIRMIKEYELAETDE
jgi:phage replication initiation protein